MGQNTANETTTKSTIKKVLSIVGNALILIVIALAIFVLVISVTAKKDSDGTATVFGKQLRFVQSSSMEKCDQTDVSAYKIKSIKLKSCVFIDVIPDDEAKKEEWLKTIKVGDVLTFKYVYTKQETITHRVVKIEEKETGGYIITLEGDNKVDKNTVGQQTIDTSQWDSPNYIIGRVTGQSYLLGLLVYFFKQPVGIIFFIIVPCLVMIAFQVMRIVKVVNADKKEKAAAEKATQTNEIEELKRQLAALQQNASGAGEKTEIQPQMQTQTETPSESTDE